MAITINQGTQTAIATDSVGTLQYGIVKLDMGTLGGSNPFLGTILSTQINPLPAANTILHAGTSGTIAIGTLVDNPAIGAGTALYPTHYLITNISGTQEVCLSFGTVINGPQVVVHALLLAGGNINGDIMYPNGYGTTNSPLTYQVLSGSGTVGWDVNYFLHT